MSGPEQKYCRSPLAREVNKTPGWMWLSTHNPGNGRYDSGFPDGIVAQVGQAATAAERELSIVLSCQLMSYKRMLSKAAVPNIGFTRFIYVECKAFFGSITFGDENEEETGGWHGSQRNWYETIAAPMGLDYRILAWAYPEHRRGVIKVAPRKAKLYLVTPQDWYDLEGKTDRKSMALNMDLERVHDYKNTTVEHFWKDKEVSFKTLTHTLCQTQQ